MLQNNFKICVALDIETTDLSPDKGEIIEVGAVKFRGRKIIDKFQTLINPKIKVPSFISFLTSITNKELQKSPELKNIKKKFIEFIADYPIVGHNICFDLDFLAEKNIKLSNSRFDTWKLATILLPGLSSYSLDSLAKFLEIKYLEQHRAFEDAKVSMELFLFLVNKIYEIDSDLMKEICQLLSKQKWDLAEVFLEIEDKRKKLKRRFIKTRGKIEAKKEKTADRQKGIKFNFEEIDKIFNQKGALTKALDKFDLQPSQIDILNDVAGAFVKKKHLVIEHSPEVDKSLAYLVPAVYYSQASRNKVFILTYSFGLIKQLLTKDIPLIQKIVPFDFKASLLLDSAKYLCLRRFKIFKRKFYQNKSYEQELTSLIKILLWLPTTTQGLLTEVAWVIGDENVQEKIIAEKEFCMGRKCPYYKDCFWFKAQKKAKEADLVVSNYSLIPFGLKGGLKSSLDIHHLICDEAHLLEEALITCYSFYLNQKKIVNFLDGLYLSLFTHLVQIDLPDKIDMLLVEIKKQVQSAISQVDLFFGILGIFIKKRLELADPFQKLILNDSVKGEIDFIRVESSCRNLIIKLEDLIKNLMILEKEIKRISPQKFFLIESAQDLKGYISKLKTLQINLEKTILKQDHKRLIFLEFLSPDIVNIKSSPSGLADELEMFFRSKGTVILTSSALSVEGEFKYLKERLGLGEDFDFFRFKPSYDYKKQVLIFIPVDMPIYGHSGYNNAVAEIIKKTSLYISGRIVVLFTSYSAIKTIYKKIFLYFQKNDMKVLAAGIAGGRTKIFDQFVQNHKSILLTTHQFFRKANFPKGHLKCLIIAKLPFERIEESASRARSKIYFNTFLEFVLPQAILNFKQDFNKLAEGQKGKKFMIILDRRIEKEKYGLKFLASLPECSIKYGKLEEISKITEEWKV